MKCGWSWREPPCGLGEANLPQSADPYMPTRGRDDRTFTVMDMYPKG